jgi:hypothetical protein
MRDHPGGAAWSDASQMTQGTPLAESQRGIAGPAEHRTLIDAMSSSSTSAFKKPPRRSLHVPLTKTPAYTSSPLFSPARTTLKEVNPPPL